MKMAGQAFDFWIAPEALKCPDARPIDLAVGRWVLAHGGDIGLARLAVRASLADGQGESAIRIDDATERKRLADARRWVADGLGEAPFVLSGELFYLRRNFAHESVVAEHLHALLQSAQTAEEIDLDGLFADPADTRVIDQQTAVRKVLGQRLFVLSGGPGTGKTTTVLRMLMALSRASACLPEIHLAAPTGKAAQRLGESLRNARAEDFAPHWQAALAHVRESRTGTVHRLLGSRGLLGGWQHDGNAPLSADIVVVDEASMLDLALLRGLLQALKPGARLILVGDAGQLDSVGTGSVLQDIVALLGEASPALQYLRHSFRADQALLPLNEATRDGDVAGFWAAANAAGSQVEIRPVQDKAVLETALQEWSDALWQTSVVHGVTKRHAATDGDAISRALQCLKQHQLLSALRLGNLGAEGLNTQLEVLLRNRAGITAESLRQGEWYVGRRIIITRNDPATGLWNGDVGLALEGEDGQLRVWFEGADGQPRGFDIAALPAHAPAFAITVHKAQGSEYTHVAVVLPHDAEHALLSRQWFYTAISRAKHSVKILAAPDAITHAITHLAQRISGLPERVRALSDGAR